ncbi:MULTISPECIES: hypothetical protein [Streptomyces]|uniref:hypothetical protein n=1 Tax=Streptomyces TaxID=1883 RepID=UPI0018AC9293|nr:hypothetical protein [Streptomyces sp. BRB081]MBL3803291.1 hypothetical protein [Streptomyces sp. BRB081]
MSGTAGSTGLTGLTARGTSLTGVPTELASGHGRAVLAPAVRRCSPPLRRWSAPPGVFLAPDGS